MACSLGYACASSWCCPWAAGRAPRRAARCWARAPCAWRRMGAGWGRAPPGWRRAAATIISVSILTCIGAICANTHVQARTAIVRGHRNGWPIVAIGWPSVTHKLQKNVTLACTLAQTRNSLHTLTRVLRRAQGPYSCAKRSSRGDPPGSRGGRPGAAWGAVRVGTLPTCAGSLFFDFNDSGWRGIWLAGSAFLPRANCKSSYDHRWEMQVRAPVDEDDAWGNRANCAVPYWSKENIWEAAGEGILQSRDLTPDFRPNLQGTAGNAVQDGKTRFGTQDAPYPRASKPDLRVPLGPRPQQRRAGSGGEQRQSPGRRRPQPSRASTWPRRRCARRWRSRRSRDGGAQRQACAHGAGAGPGAQGPPRLHRGAHDLPRPGTNMRDCHF